MIYCKIMTNVLHLMLHLTIFSRYTLIHPYGGKIHETQMKNQTKHKEHVPGTACI